jgi:pimeloyl-ACP methyl ester carboxylesterase
MDPARCALPLRLCGNGEFSLGEARRRPAWRARKWRSGARARSCAELALANTLGQSFMNTAPINVLDHETLPEVAGARAFRRFCTPHLSNCRSVDHEQLVRRARFHLRSARRQRLATSVGEIETYVFEPKGITTASALLVHGWTGEAAFMSAFAEYLCRRNIRCVLLDLPAHGQSAGYETNLMDCARAVHDVAQSMGPLRFAIGHSIGGLAVLMAGEGRHPMLGPVAFEAYVLVAVPDRFADVTRRFGDDLGLSAAGLQAFERRLEHLAQRRIADFRGSNFLSVIERPCLLLHARDDLEVPFADAERMATVAPTVELAALDGLGHRAILYAPPAVRAAAAFLARFA